MLNHGVGNRFAPFEACISVLWCYDNYPGGIGIITPGYRVFS